MRTINRLIAAVLALGLIAVGLLTVAEIVFAALGLAPLVVPHESWLETARGSSYGDRSVIVVAIALVALGLVLSALQLLRRSPRATRCCPSTTAPRLGSTAGALSRLLLELLAMSMGYRRFAAARAPASWW